MDLKILGPYVTLSCEQHFDILGGSIEDRGGMYRRHD